MSTNAMLSEIADLLVTGAAEPNVACASRLPTDKLDYTIASLAALDEYLDFVHVPFRRCMNTGSLAPSEFEAVDADAAQESLKSTIIRCGAYAGEVIRRNGRRDLEWFEFDQAIRHFPHLMPILGSEMEFGTSFVLGNRYGTVLLPLEKVYKYLEAGAEDSVLAMAKVVIAKGETEGLKVK